jgi:hypothetical protein
MGFLDNLENSLKSLEQQEDRDANQQQRREQERARALEEAPWAEKLKNSEFTKLLFDKAALAGHRLRTKIYMAWFGNVLRLEAKERRLELRPTAKGISAVFLEPDGAESSQTIDLSSDPQTLLDQWLHIEAQKGSK